MNPVQKKLLHSLIDCERSEALQVFDFVDKSNMWSNQKNYENTLVEETQIYLFIAHRTQKEGGVELATVLDNFAGMNEQKRMRVFKCLNNLENSGKIYQARKNFFKQTVIEDE